MNKILNLFMMSIIIATVVALDQYTKWMVVQHLSQREFLTIIPGFFNIVLTYNKGAAFGLFSGIQDDLIRHTLLGASTLIALAVVVYLLGKDYMSDVIAKCALALILGGAIGNIIDRIRIGAVIDFLDVWYGTYHWPAFNVADSAICIGVLILLFRKPRPARKIVP